MNQAEHPEGHTRVFIVGGHALVRRGLAALLDGESDLRCCGESDCGETAVQGVVTTQPDVVIAAGDTLRGPGLPILQRIRNVMTHGRVIALASPQRAQRLPSGAVDLVVENGFAARLLDAVRRTRVAQSHPNGSASKALREINHGEMFGGLEQEVVRLIGQGIPEPEIAIRLALSRADVRAYRRLIRKKLNSPPVTQFVELCAQWERRRSRRVA